MCTPPDKEHVPPGLPIATPSRPDQPASDVPPVPQLDDPLANYLCQSSLLWGSITRVPLAGAC